MALSEFELIARFFARTPVERPEVVVGVGDDAAVLAVPSDREVLVDASRWALDRDFAADDPPASIAQRALGAALARIAARGAEPFAFTLALTLPDVDEAWLEAFSAALAALARRHRVALVGGDTTRGPLAIVFHVQGLTAPGGPVPARGAREGDLLYVSGPVGGAALAMLERMGEVRLPANARNAALQALQYPRPPLGLGGALVGVASAAGTLGGGLEAALQALLAGTGNGAEVQLEQLPVDPLLAPRLQQPGGWSLLRDEPAPTLVCFALPPSRQQALAARLRDTAVEAAWIGTVVRTAGVRFLLPDGGAL